MNTLKTTLAFALLAAFSQSRAALLLQLDAPAPQAIAATAPVTEAGKPPRKEIDLASRLASNIRQKGAPPRELPPVKGMGQDVLFMDALKQILPAGWKVYSDEEIAEETLVSWLGNRNWPLVLNTVLASTNLNAEVDWDKAEVTLTRKPAQHPTVAISPTAHPSPEMITETANDTGRDVTLAISNLKPIAAQVVDSSMAPLQKVVAKLAATQNLTWKLSKDMFLRENIRAWAVQQGWTVEWQAAIGDRVINYPVNADATLTGDLIGKGGVIDQLVSKYEHADEPLGVHFYRGNKVVEVYLYSEINPLISN